MPRAGSRRRRPHCLLVNASLNGADGNTAALLDLAKRALAKNAETQVVQLDSSSTFAQLEPELRAADAFVFGTGTHWDSWSHYLQKFLEEATPSEGTATWLGKPVGVIVTMHSVGGKAVLSRLQGVLNTFGCVIPPQSGMVYSLVNQIAFENGNSATDDLWCTDDVKIIAHNVLAAINPQHHYRSWPVDRKTYHDRWVKL